MVAVRFKKFNLLFIRVSSVNSIFIYLCCVSSWPYFQQDYFKPLNNIKNDINIPIWNKLLYTGYLFSQVINYKLFMGASVTMFNLSLVLKLIKGRTGWIVYVYLRMDANIESLFYIQILIIHFLILSTVSFELFYQIINLFCTFNRKIKS